MLFMVVPVLIMMQVDVVAISNFCDDELARLPSRMSVDLITNYKLQSFRKPLDSLVWLWI
uniref:Uncharacterized protein n=1 Tax=Meloidogyne incognita TaxID=6306 RepID=A0A914MG14_MELIC